MKKKKSNRKLILVLVGAVLAIITVILIILQVLGFDVFSTLSGQSEGKPTSFASVDELESGKAYVWHHDGVKIEDDLSDTVEKNVFFTCIPGDYNFKGKEMEEFSEYPRSVWFDTSTDDGIPTVTSKDKLIYVSKTDVPENIVFERFADYGYTIGVSNMIADLGGHYYILFADTDDDDYKYFLDMKSDASQLVELTDITRLYLDKVGKVRVDENTVSDGGTVLGLEKDKNYVCEFYTGTYYQDFKLCANIHSFGSMERFVSYDYEFMHSNFIVIDIPDYFKTGYYYVNGVGMFRYISDEDAIQYNGKSYDAAIEWNEPIKQYDSDGVCIYDPSDPDFEEKKVEELSDPGDEKATPEVDDTEEIKKEEITDE